MGLYVTEVEMQIYLGKSSWGIVHIGDISPLEKQISSRLCMEPKGNSWFCWPWSCSGVRCVLSKVNSKLPLLRLFSSGKQEDCTDTTIRALRSDIFLCMLMHRDDHLSKKGNRKFGISLCSVWIPLIPLISFAWRSIYVKNPGRDWRWGG